MGYDIPDEIKYKEKILLNLDLKQLGYAILFGIGALLLYNLPIKGDFRLILPSLAVCSGLAFAFLNIEDKVLDLIAFYRNVRKATPYDLSAQGFIGVKAVKNDAIYLDNGELRAVLKVEPVNFELLSEERKKSLVLNYRDFLNQLVNPVQVLIRTSDVSLADYFDAQEKKFQNSSKEFSSLYTDFRIFEEGFVESKGVKERNYYLVVTHAQKKQLGRKIVGAIFKQEDAELKRLDQQVEIIEEKLGNCGLESKRLDSKQLVSLLLSYSEYEGENGAVQEEQKKPKPKPNFIQKTFPFLARKKVESEDPAKELFKFMMTPSFDVRPQEAKVNETWHRIVKVGGYPRKVEDGWLESFLGNNEGYDISLHIHPSTIAQTLVLLHNQIIRQTADLMMSTAKGTPNPALEIKRADTMRTYEQLYKGEEKLFRVSLYVDNKEANLEKLDLLTEKCNANLNAMLMIPKAANYRMAEGIKSSLPLGVDALASQREFLTSPLSATFPFISPASTKRTGIMFAHEEETQNPLFVDFDSMSNKHFFVLGISGSGKSYTAKYLTIQHLLNEEARVYILDPNAEYGELAKNLNGEVVELSKGSDSIINVFDLGGEDFGSKMLSLISVFDIIAGGLTESQKGVLNEALLDVYKKKGIVFDKPATWSREPPTFSDFKLVLQEMLRESADRGKASFEDRSAEVLLNRVRMYSKSGFFGFLDKQTKINLKSEFATFDLSKLPGPVKQLMMFVVLDLISREIKRDKKPKVVLIDEGWSLLKSKEAEQYILEFIKTSRKYNASIGFITQEIEDLLRSEGGKSILNLTSTKLLLRQNPSNLELVSNALKLNDSEKDYLLRASKGHGLLITEEGHYRFFTMAPPKIHALITTDPNEAKKKIEETEKHYAEEGVKIDLAKGFYALSEVTEKQADALRKEGYVLHKDKLTGREGSAYYLVKTQGSESPEHALFCWIIADAFKQRKIRVEVNASREADVVAHIGKKRICFEVETGENLLSKLDDFTKKIDTEKSEYDAVVILVTDRLLKYKYAKFAKTITRAEIAQTIAEMASKYS
ncbi:AAA-like domain protein [Candidatus Burarchaeum australiense]|nr:AAA-like domain protein [Candidatus Burarchaeum australiense]